MEVVREGSESSPTADTGHPIQGIPIASVMSSFFGFKEASIPQPGSRVLCVSHSASLCFILGSIPRETLEDGKVNLPSRTILGAGNAIDDTSNRKGHSDRFIAFADGGCPTDVVDGEHVVANELGVLLGLQQQLATLKASELAQIQCFLLDDLVRIISHNFQHYTALGEYNIFHDGKRLLAEFGATHKVAETYGVPAVNNDATSKTTFQSTGTHTSDDAQDFYKINGDEQLKAIERFKLFLGSVGDFLHMFLLRPDPEEQRSLNPAQEINSPDVGLFDFHVGTDGGLHVRSVKEVFIEKTNWIRVPIRKCAPDDPAGDDAETVNYDEKKSFEFNNEHSYLQTPLNYALQIRDYVAYVNEKLGYQNFKKHEKDFHVNDSPENEEAFEQINKVDAETKLELSEYQLRTAGIYLMPNGGITIRDAWNSAIVMEGGNIYLQPAKDLISQPLRHYVAKVGGNVSISAKKDVDVSSSEEGVRFKSLKTMHMYSAEGGVVVEADGEKDSTPYPEFDTAEEAENSALEYVGGIVLKSKLHIYNKAEKNIVTHTGGRMLFQSLDNISLVSDNLFTLYSKRDMYCLSDGGIYSLAQTSLQSVSFGSANFAGATSTVLGQKDQTIGVVSLGPVKGVIDVPKAYTEFYFRLADINKDLLKQTTYQEEKTFDNVKFRFLSSSKYGVSSDFDGIPTTLPQQENLVSEAVDLVAWEEESVNGTLPFPGGKLFDQFYYFAEKPNNIEQRTKKGGRAEAYSMAASGEKPCKITLESLAKYKVHK